MVELKRWGKLVRTGEHHHLAVILFLPDRAARLHSHDFPEVFWLESGQGVHEINGQVRNIYAGDLIFVRPEDRHVLRAVHPGGFTLINLAYAPRVRTGLLSRHPREMTPLLAPSGTLPHRARLSRPALASLRKQVEFLAAAGPGARVPLEHFLLGLYLQVTPRSPVEATAMPDWLQQASEQVQRPELFSQGANGLVKAAGRSPEHVARTMREILGMTPTDYVNRIRMEHAARELRVTNRPIAEIALECGINNLSHFYHLFRTAHRTSPRAYRKEHQRVIA